MMQVALARAAHVKGCLKSAPKSVSNTAGLLSMRVQIPAFPILCPAAANA
jgi:hypothetical protein